MSWRTIRSQNNLYLQPLALPLDDVDIELELCDHLPPGVRGAAQLRQLALVLLDLCQEPGVEVPVAGHLGVEAAEHLVRGGGSSVLVSAV